MEIIHLKMTTNSMRNFVLVINILFLLIFCPSCQKESAQDRIEKYSGIELPDGMVEVYNFVDDTFIGLAGQYAVFKVHEEPDLFKKVELGKIYLSLEENILEFLENSFQVPKEFFPDFNVDYKYITGRENTYVFYFLEELEIKIIMFGH